MTREDILRERLDMASHNLHCYSANWSLATPKPGFEANHKEAVAEVEILKTWLEELEASYEDPIRGVAVELAGGDGRPRTFGIKLKVVGEHFTEEYQGEVYEAFLPKVRQLMFELDPNP